MVAPTAVMAGLDPAIQGHTEFTGFFVDGPVKPGHDNWVLDDRADFFTRSKARMLESAMTVKWSSFLAASIISAGRTPVAATGL